MQTSGPWLFVTLSSAFLAACQWLAEPIDPPAGTKPGSADPAVTTDSPTSDAGPAEEIAPHAIPGPDGPFIEPPLARRPDQLFCVVAGRAAKLTALETPMARLAALAFVPIGFPAVDQAAGLLEPGTGYVLLAGKFARRAWAEALATALRKAGWEPVEVRGRRYRFDRRQPALNDAPGRKAGRVFAGMAQAKLPLLADARRQARGTGQMLVDGALVEVTGHEWVGPRLWYRVSRDEHQGFLAAERVLVDGNVFPTATGRRAVLGVGLGCRQDSCRWDYWLVGRNYAVRRLLKSASARMPHDLSPDGRWLAYTSFSPTIEVTQTEGHSTFSLGPGTSPIFSPDGRVLFFRGPGVNDQRDAVMASAVDTWNQPEPKTKLRVVLDFRGTPMYPRALSTIPPPVDVREGGSELFTLFYRLVHKNGRRQIQRWGVRFTPDGKVLEKAGVLISQ